MFFFSLEELCELAATIFLPIGRSNFLSLLRFQTNRQSFSFTFTDLHSFPPLCFHSTGRFTKKSNGCSRPGTPRKKGLEKKNYAVAMVTTSFKRNAFSKQLRLRDKTHNILLCFAVFAPSIDLVIEQTKHVVFHEVFAGLASKPCVSTVGRLGTRHPAAVVFYSFCSYS